VLNLQIYTNNGGVMKEYKIGWQKYEDYLEQQLSSPMLDILSDMMLKKMEQVETENAEEYEESYEDTDSSEIKNSSSSIIPISPKLMEDISMLSNYDCWMGHTNFDITNEIKDTLDLVDGIEMLKICSRYRFFIGIGRMFDFADVRTIIEDNIIPKQED
jgi:hypothetical protein